MPRLVAEALADAGKDRVDTIVAGGGDSTVNEVFSSAFKLGIPAKCSFGILPLGTANDFARSAGLPDDDLTAALLMIADTAAAPIDLGLLDGRPFVNMLTGGFGSQVTAETDPALKHRLGSLAYALTGLLQIGNLSASSASFAAKALNGRAPSVLSRLATAGRRAAELALPGRHHQRRPVGLDDHAASSTSRTGRSAGHAIAPGQIRRAQSDKNCQEPLVQLRIDRRPACNLDGEPIRTKSFRAECRPAAISVHLGNSPLLAPPVKGGPEAA